MFSSVFLPAAETAICFFQNVAQRVAVNFIIFQNFRREIRQRSLFFGIKTGNICRIRLKIQKQTRLTGNFGKGKWLDFERSFLQKTDRFVIHQAIIRFNSAKLQTKRTSSAEAELVLHFSFTHRINCPSTKCAGACCWKPPPEFVPDGKFPTNAFRPECVPGRTGRRSSSSNAGSPYSSLSYRPASR